MSILESEFYPKDKQSFLITLYNFSHLVDIKKLEVYYDTFGAYFDLKVEVTLNSNSVFINLINLKNKDSLLIKFFEK